MAKKKSSTPMMDQYHAIKEAHRDKLLLFRMGDFYELFFDDAVKAHELLGLVLTSRSKGENPIPMAGLPHHQLERYLKDLINAGQKVAICDQLEDPAAAKGIVKRGVTRVVTPGTVLEEACLPGESNNFLCAVDPGEARAGLAWIDISTGEFLVLNVPPEQLGDEIERLAPAETLVPREAMRDGEALHDTLKHRHLGALSRRDDYDFDIAGGARRLLDHFGVATLDGFGLSPDDPAIGAAGAILAYLGETQLTELAHVRRLRLITRSDHLVLDRTTQRNLELTHALLQGGRDSTLLKVIDRTRTAPGARRMKDWLLNPLAALAPIRRRQEAVGELMHDHLLRAELREILAGIADLERIMARVATGRVNARELVALRRSAEQLPTLAAVAGRMQAPLLLELAGDIDLLEDMAGRIAATLVDEPPAALKDGGLIRAGVEAQLDELREVRAGGKDWIKQFQQAEQERTGIPSLKVGFNKVFGYYIEVTHTHKDKVPEDYDRKQTLTNAERYITPALKERERQVLGAEERIVELEYRLFIALRDEMAAHIERVQAVAHALAALDVLAALAEYGALRQCCLPEVHESIDSAIVEGRHPVVETLLPENEFVPNDTRFGEADSLIQIITGPNMAGKSTYIRQVALLTVLAQMGAPVPAKSMTLGLVDRIFTRVGAADDLARGQSTFMVEMAETANILNNATDRSLIILDEVGRGTSTFDGVSLAWAITEFLHHRVRARTLFATHYHELAELGVILERAENHNVAVRDWSGEIIFLHKIQPGASDRSYGIQVARLAGLPPETIERAREILLGLENQAADRDYNYLREGEVLRAAAREVQMDLFAPQHVPPDPLVEEIAKIDPDHFSPMQALQEIQKLVQKARKKAGL